MILIKFYDVNRIFSVTPTYLQKKNIGKYAGRSNFILKSRTNFSSFKIIKIVKMVFQYRKRLKVKNVINKKCMIYI